MRRFPVSSISANSNLGSWFYFVDVDFSSKFVEGAYAEISREFNLGKQ